MRRLLCLLTWITCCAAGSLVAAEPEATPGEWKLVSTSDNVALYRRSRPGPGHYESKAIGEIAASTSAVHAVIDDVDSYPRFMPYTVECRVLKREGDSVLTYQRISAPLVSDRDYTMRVRTTSRTVEGGTSYRSRWETENAAGPAERPGIVRVKLCEGGWLLEPTGPDATRATYTVYTDSGGVIPGFIKNTGSQIGIRKIFAAIRRQVRDPKYKAEGGGRKAEGGRRKAEGGRRKAEGGGRRAEGGGLKAEGGRLRMRLMATFHVLGHRDKDCDQFICFVAKWLDQRWLYHTRVSQQF